MGRSWRVGAGIVAAAAVAAGGLACDSDDDSGDGAGPGEGAEEVTGPVPEVEGPITGGIRGGPVNATPEDVLTDFGYVEDEYFLSGEATSYTPVGELASDGRWEVEEASPAPYTTRVLVRRPADLEDFNGTAVVEWFNVTGGLDVDPTFGLTYPAGFERGAVYIAVTAQAVGVEGGGPTIEVPEAGADLVAPLTVRDPERYGSLSHPGDDFSYDIVTQVGRAALAGDLTDGTQTGRLLLVGQSQSAGRIATYINAIEPVEDVYDGFLVHSRGDGAAPVAAEAAVQPPDVVMIRTDLDEEVLQFETEGDLERLGFIAARQDDTDRIVTWEVPGTAHADDTILAFGQVSVGIEFDVAATCGSVNTGPHGEVLRAAFTGLDEWVTEGTTPPTSPRIETEGAAVVRDELGNAVGGIRTPQVDAPVSALSGVGEPGASEFCGIFGSEVPFTPEQLAQLYPTHDDYVEAVTESAEAAVEAGFLLPADRDAFVTDAEAAAVPS